MLDTFVDSSARDTSDTVTYVTSLACARVLNGDTAAEAIMTAARRIFEAIIVLLICSLMYLPCQKRIMRQGLVVRPCSVLLKATATSSARRQDGKRRSVLPRSNIIRPEARRQKSMRAMRVREQESSTRRQPVVWAQGSPRFRVPVQGLVRSDRTNKPCYPVQRRMLKMAREGGVQSNFCQGYISKILTVPLGLHLQLATTLDS